MASGPSLSRYPSWLHFWCLLNISGLQNKPSLPPSYSCLFLLRHYSALHTNGNGEFVRSLNLVNFGATAVIKDHGASFAICSKVYFKTYNYASKGSLDSYIAYYKDHEVWYIDIKAVVNDHFIDNYSSQGSSRHEVHIRISVRLKVFSALSLGRMIRHQNHALHLELKCDHQAHDVMKFIYYHHGDHHD